MDKRQGTYIACDCSHNKHVGTIVFPLDEKTQRAAQLAGYQSYFMEEVDVKVDKEKGDESLGKSIDGTDEEIVVAFVEATRFPFLIRFFIGFGGGLLCLI